MPLSCHLTPPPTPFADLAHQQGPRAFHPPKDLTENQGGLPSDHDLCCQPGVVLISVCRRVIVTTWTPGT